VTAPALVVPSTELVNALGAAPIGSPEWWLRRLHAEIVERQPYLDLHDAYYSGNHPLPWIAPKARAEFRRIFKMTRANLMGLVCDAHGGASCARGLPDAR
jgi:hypothetical protein